MTWIIKGTVKFKGLIDALHSPSWKITGIVYLKVLLVVGILPQGKVLKGQSIKCLVNIPFIICIGKVLKWQSIECLVDILWILRL